MLFKKNICRFLICLVTFSSNVIAEDSFFDAVFKNGKPHLILRYRYEHVDDNALQASGATLKQADASTLRTFAGFESGSFHGFSATIDIENITDIGIDDFNDGSNGKTQFATVVDPDGTELEQGFLQYSGIENTVFKGGRQYITYRKNPFHRFIGTILWRQNWQNFDAVTIQNMSLSDTTINYAYVWNVNRIFGNDAPEPLSHFDSNSHLVNIKYNGFEIVDIEAYSYLLDLENADGFSTQTYGARVSGNHSLNEKFSTIYALEYAYQSDFADNTADIDADYFFGEFGIKFKPDFDLIKSVVFKFNAELFSGDGGADRFVTILGTNHPFQGWADRFLVTPGDGIEDLYGSMIFNIAGAKLIAVYHNFSSDRDSYDYGNELDLLLTRTFKKRYTLGLKYANYDADTNATNVARNASQSADKSNFWAFFQFKY